MPGLSDFRLGAEVVDSDGQRAGTLISVLVDEDGFDPRALVVKDQTSVVGRLLAAERLLITDEVVIPISAVESASHRLVRLSMAGSDVRRQKPYISYRFEPQSRGAATMREAQLLSGGLGMPGLEEVANKPQRQIEVDRDENVMIGKTGRRLGKVQDLLYHDAELIGLVVRPDGFFKEEVVLPIRFLSRGDDMALFAEIDKNDIEQLKPFVEQD